MKIQLLSLICLIFAMPAQCATMKVSLPRVITCAQATLSKPGLGRKFQGSVINEDYAFIAQIPKGMTAWDGVDENAPFHGFTIFLDSKMNGCIWFEIHVRVNENDRPRYSHSAKSVSLGDVSARQLIRRGTVANAGLVNINATFSFKHDQQTDDGEILLIVPESQLVEAKQLYNNFLATMKFSGK